MELMPLVQVVVRRQLKRRHVLRSLRSCHHAWYRVGLAPTGKRRLCTAHTRNGHLLRTKLDPRGAPLRNSSVSLIARKLVQHVYRTNVLQPQRSRKADPTATRRDRRNRGSDLRYRIRDLRSRKSILD